MSEEQLDLLNWLANQPPCPPKIDPDPEGAPVELAPASVRLIRTNRASNMHRFYSLEFGTSLFGERGIVRH